MPLNPVSGNMYHHLITHTWNPVKGRCIHDCKYCFMKAPKYSKMKDVRLVDRELKTDLGTDNFIFVGSSTDFFARNVKTEWIEAVLQKCRSSESHFLFQSKDPARFLNFAGVDLRHHGSYPRNVTFATTLESDLDHKEAYSPPDSRYSPKEKGWVWEGQPSVDVRVNGIIRVKQASYPVTITIEPVMSFDLSTFREILDDIGPEWISIGADSQNSNLPEPTGDEVRALIHELEKAGHTVIQKSNLGRLLK